MADESYLSKTNKFLKKWTGGDYYERNTEAAKKKFRDAAPKTAAAVEKTADVLGRGAQYESGGGPLIGMAKRAKAGEAVAEGAAKVRTAEGLKPKSQVFKDKLEAVRAKNAGARMDSVAAKTPKTGSSTFTDRMGSAKKDGGARVNPGKYNPLGSIKVKEMPKKPEAKPEVPKSSDAKKVGKAAAATAVIAGGYYGSKRWSEARKDKGAVNPSKRVFGGPKPRRDIVGQLGGTGVVGYSSARDPDYGGRLPAKKETKTGVIGGAGVAGYGNSRDNTMQLGKNAKERRYFSVDKSKVPTPKARPAKSKTRIAFEKEFAKNRAKGASQFAFRGKKYNTKLK